MKTKKKHEMKMANEYDKESRLRAMKDEIKKSLKSSFCDKRQIYKEEVDDENTEFQTFCFIKKI
jgi:hypothetical protein